MATLFKHPPVIWSGPIGTGLNKLIETKNAQTPHDIKFYCIKEYCKHLVFAQLFLLQNPDGKGEMLFVAMIAKIMKDPCLDKAASLKGPSTLS